MGVRHRRRRHQLDEQALELELIVFGLPFIGFAVIAAAAIVAIQRPGNGFARPPGAGAAMMWSSIGEGVALFLVNQLALSFGRSDLILPGMALVVGPHFVPIAFWAPFRPLYLLAGGIVLGAVAGGTLPQPVGGAVAGFTAALALAVASVAAVRREILAKASTNILPKVAGCAG